MIFGRKGKKPLSIWMNFSQKQGPTVLKRKTSKRSNCVALFNFI